MKRNIAIILAQALISFTCLSAADYRDEECRECQSTCRERSSLIPFDVQIKGLYLKPLSNARHYAAEAVPLPTPTPNWKIHAIDPSYHGAFEVAISRDLLINYSLVGVNWMHFSSNDKASKSLSSQNMIGPFFEIGPDALPYKKAVGKLSFDFDKIDFTWGIYLSCSYFTHIDFTSAVGFVKIDQTLTSTFSDLEGTIHRTIDSPSSFKGAGPQFGLNILHKIVNCLDLKGEALVSLYWGKAKNSTSYKSYSPALGELDITPPNSQSTRMKGSCEAVPALRGALGLSYHSYTSLCCMTVEAGYQAEIYINAIKSVEIGSEVVTPPVVADTVGVYARTFQCHYSNFSLGGPYLKVNFSF